MSRSAIRPAFVHAVVRMSFLRLGEGARSWGKIQGRLNIRQAVQPGSDWRRKPAWRCLLRREFPASSVVETPVALNDGGRAGVGF